MDYYEQEQIDHMRAEARAHWLGFFFGVGSTCMVAAVAWAVSHV